MKAYFVRLTPDGQRIASFSSTPLADLEKREKEYGHTYLPILQRGPFHDGCRHACLADSWSKAFAIMGLFNLR